MSIPPIGPRSTLPGYHPPTAASFAQNFPQGILLAQAGGSLPSEQPPKLELLGKDEFLRQTVPGNITPAQLAGKANYGSAQDIDDFLSESGTHLVLTLGDKTIGTILLHNKTLSEQDAKDIVRGLDANFFKPGIIRDPKNNRRHILSRMADFTKQNNDTHAAINYYERLLNLDGRGVPGGQLAITPKARRVIEKRVQELQDILYQSYRNVPGRLLTIDPSGLSDEQEIFHARLMLVTRKILTGNKDHDNQIANDYFQSKVKRPDPSPARQIKQLFAAIRSDLARIWFQEIEPVRTPEPPETVAEAKPEQTQYPLDQLMEQAIQKEQQPGALARQPVPPLGEPKPTPLAAKPKKQGVAVKAEASLEEGFEVAVQTPRIPSRVLEFGLRGGPLFGNRLWSRPPQIGARVAAESLELRREVSDRSGLDRTDSNSNGLLGAAELNVHPLGRLGRPYGSLFVMGGVEAGYTGNYDGQPIVSIDLQTGTGLNLFRLFRSNPDWDAVVRTVLLRGGYNNFMEDYSDWGSSKYGVCGRFSNWQACLDYSRLSRTGESGDKLRPGQETQKLNWFLLSIGHYWLGL